MPDDAVLPREVADHDPPLALWGGPDGLDVVRGMLTVAARLLHPGGWLGIEHADQQGGCAARRRPRARGLRPRSRTTPTSPAGPASPPPAAAERRGGDCCPVADLYDCSDPEPAPPASTPPPPRSARGELVLMPTDTVYGVAADAFTPSAVDRAARGQEPRPARCPSRCSSARRRRWPGSCVNLPPTAHQLAQAFWPGGLTLVLEHAPSLAWDLGDAEGTVAVRLPDDDVARDLLRRTGPLAVSSANRSGRPAATSAQEAIEQLGSHAAVVLDGGPRASSAASTIVDCTGPTPRVLRVGAIPLDRLREVVPDIHGLNESRRSGAHRRSARGAAERASHALRFL